MEKIFFLSWILWALHINVALRVSQKNVALGAEIYTTCFVVSLDGRLFFTMSPSYSVYLVEVESQFFIWVERREV